MLNADVKDPSGWQQEWGHVGVFSVRALPYPRLPGAVHTVFERTVYRPGDFPLKEQRRPLFCRDDRSGDEMRIVVAITGASGVAYGIQLLKDLKELGIERHLVLSRWAEATIAKETSLAPRDVAAMASVVHARANVGAEIASGSFRHDGMIIAPCSMKTLAAIRLGYSDGLIPRAADVTLKERRRLVLMPRETPLNEIHLENMLALCRMGALIVPPMPAFYNNPRTIEDLVEQTSARVLDLFGLETPQIRRWNGMRAEFSPAIVRASAMNKGGSR
jgi:flavin prenyltransferase